VPVEDLQAVVHDLLGGRLPGFIAMPPMKSEEWSIWDSGEWWMLLAAQSMAIGTVMMRWVSKFSDPIMVIGWVSFNPFLPPPLFFFFFLSDIYL
jgi:hypothetical protein